MKELSRRAAALAICLAKSALLPACEDPVTDPSVITGPRIVGARVAADGDAALAEPSAGDTATIDWLVLSDQLGAFSARVVWCVAAPSVLGAPRCEAGVFEDQSLTGELGRPLRLEFGLPGELAAGSAWLAWLGICDAGDPPVFDVAASAFRCAEGAALSGFYRGFIPEGVPNQNPSLADDRLALAGADWLASALAADGLPPRSACRELGLPLVSIEQPASVVFELGGDDREPLASTPGTYAAHERESLVYTHLSSHSGLERAFSAIDFDAATARFEVPFDFGAVAPGPDGELSSFYLLVRDERGGVDWLRRDACLITADTNSQ
jgi:hypothetical protein